MKPLTQAIADNRRRHARYEKYTLLRRKIRQRIFDYEDQGKLEKAERILGKTNKILTPLWEALAHAAERARSDRMMHTHT